MEIVSESTLIDQIKKLSDKNKEENIDQMMRILIDGASQQYQYMASLLEGSNAYAGEEFDIFDI